MDKKRDGRTSDALLSCPACFTTVCLECQRYFPLSTSELGVLSSYDCYIPSRLCFLNVARAPLFNPHQCVC